MDEDLYVPQEKQTPAERDTLRQLQCAFDKRGVPVEARIVDVEPPHRSEQATTVEVRVPARPGSADTDAEVARVVRVIWYDDVKDDDAYTALAEELQGEARGQLTG